MRIPKILSSIPEVPANGNYVCTGHHAFSHAESFSEAYRLWRGSLNPGGAYCPYGSAKILAGLAVVDVSDDFRICHVTGGVSAVALDVAYRGGHYPDGPEDD